MSLRGRVTLVLVVLLAVGLGISGWATSTAMRSALRHRVDAQLREVEPLAREQLLEHGEAAPPTKVPATAKAAAGEVLVARIDPGGTVVDRIVPPLADRSEALEAIPSRLITRARAGHPQRADVTIEGQPYRVLVRSLGKAGDVAAVVAPLRDVDTTLTRLRHLELLVGAVLLLAASGAAWWLVGIGLRPLSDMTDAAQAIADGEVDRRVQVGHSRKGEIPRLAHAFNNAFDQRQRAESKLRRFLTDASHELRTPLTTIRGYAELHRSGALSDRAASDRALSRIEGEADRMGGLVDDLLLLARLEEGHPPVTAPVDLAGLAADAVADSRAAGPAWPVVLGAAEPLTIAGDEARIRQVVANLLANVRTHCPPGTGAEVSVRCLGGEAVLAVADHGPGVAPGDGEHVFDRFWRADPSRSHLDGRHGGTGLGLSIVAAIAAAHGGRAEVVPTPGGGATFRVRLPLAAGVTEAADRPRPASSESADVEVGAGR